MKRLQAANILVLHLLTVEGLQNFFRNSLYLLLNEPDMTLVEVEYSREQTIIGLEEG